MKKLFSLKSIKTRLKFWFLAIGIIPLLIVSAVIYQQRVSSIKQEAFTKLTAIRELKITQINDWLNERTGDIKVIAKDSNLINISEFSNSPKKNVLETEQNVKQLLDRYTQNYNAWDEIFYVDAISGTVIVSSNKLSMGQDKSGEEYYKETLLRKGIYISNIYYSTSLHQPAMVFAYPVMDKIDSQKLKGIVVARVDLKNSLYNLLLDRFGMGRTGETLLINNESIALNELRWYQHAPLQLKIYAKPAVLASKGNVGIMETMDYRDEKVLAAFGYIPKVQWGFVAKQDQVEIYAAINVLIRNILIILAISIIVAYFVSNFVAATIAQPVLEMADVSKKVENGDLKARNVIKTGDELGLLSDSFNRMADSIASQMFIQQKVVELTGTLVVAENMEDFSQQLVRSFMEITGANLAVFYRRNERTDHFEHLHSIGGSAPSFEPYDSNVLEGELGKAIAFEKVIRIQDIPENTVFKIRTIAGTAVPNEIITIPLRGNGKVKAVISLASLVPFSQEHMEIINLVESPINTAFSNVLASEKTRSLTKNLEQKNQELLSQTNELKRQSDEMAAQNTEMETQQIQVEEANRLKSEFLSNMSHELRTPLNSVMALSQVLIRQAEDKLSEEELNYLKVIARNGKNLLALINDILDLAKIESGKMDFRAKLFSLSSAVEVIIERLEPVAEDKGIELSLKIADDLPQLESDEKRVHQILQNLIGNAVKFTSAGNVTVTARSDAENVHIEISDTGIGISEKNLPLIFEEFRQVDGTTARQYEGTGLGLSIAYKAVSALGGDLAVESTLGKGSKFSLTLPIRWQRIVPGSESFVPKPTAKKLSSQKTVLVVDDQPEVVTMIADYLSQAGYNTITATYGAQALELAEKYRPFAITLDIIMPDMDGFEVLQRLKESPTTRSIPTIIISIADDRETGFALGAVGYITKPVNKDTLIAEIKKIGGKSPHTIMVVDDNKFEREEMSKIINQEGMRAIVADGGTQCMQIIKKSLPDVLVLDLMMPDMDGFEVLERVRDDLATKDLPVIVVTAKELTVEDRDKLAGNATSVLTKSDTTSRTLLKEITKIIDEIGMSHEDQVSRELKTAKSVLVVEDNPVAMLQVRTVLESEGYRVDTAGGGQEALDYVKDTIPDGIILDLMMPEVDGFSVLNNIRADKTTENIPVLILTAKDLTSEDLKELNGNNIQQLVQKGDVQRDTLLQKTRLMLGEPPLVKPQEKIVPTEIPIRPPPKKVRTEGKPTILVVEDNSDNMLTVKAVLQNRYNILEATDGEIGLNMALTEQLDLVLLDMSLPKMDGFTVVGKIKAENKTRHIPVVAMTARAMKGDREKILEAGCDDYISKPIDPDDVMGKIENWLGKSS